MKRLAKNVVLASLVVGIVALIVYAFLPKPVPVDVALVTRGPLRVTVNEDGKTRIKDRYVVSTPLAGRLLRIDLEPGDSVVSGDSLLAIIEPGDPALLDVRALAATKAKVKAADAMLKRTKPALESARVALEFAESDMARLRKLGQRSAISAQELDKAETKYRINVEEFRSARFAEEIAQFELEQAQAALVQTQPESESDGRPVHFEIHAPITGRVLRVFQESSTVVSAGDQLLELGDPTDLEIEIDVLSSDAVKINPGAAVSLEQWGGDMPLQGSVRLVEPSAFTKISALGVEEQRVNVIVDFDEPLQERCNLGDGFRVEAKIIIWQHDDVLKVPTSALFRHGQDWAVFVVEEATAELRIVEIDHRNDLEAEVLKGLQESDEVIVHPGDAVRDGSAVVPQ